MRPNLGVEGRDPSKLGQCPNFKWIWVLKASLTEALFKLFVMCNTMKHMLGQSNNNNINWIQYCNPHYSFLFSILIISIYISIK